MWNKLKQVSAALLAGLALSVLVGAAAAQTSTPVPKVKQTEASVYVQHRTLPRRAKLHYGLNWGVDNLSVKWVESGALIRFSYRVVDPEKAADLNDRKLEPALFDERSHVKLVIPSLEKVGQLRNKNTPETGKSYWMAFSNKGGYAKKGDHVTVVIGKFQAKGLIVQ
jgi:hypothetical protein